jgi:hypothetical protein
MMKTIDLDRYMPELSALYSFYRYSEAAFENKEVGERIKEQEFHPLFAAASPFLKMDPQEAQNIFKKIIHEKVVNEIDSDLAVLRRQILEAAHSIFEKYLCHVVRVYLHTFPEILMDIDKQIPIRTLVELRHNSSIFDHIVEKEVSHFSRLSLQEKKGYLRKRLKHTHQDDVWTYQGEELWKDIDKKRQAIVHEEEIPEISQDYLLQAINHLQRIMMGIALNAQVDQGIKFTWAIMSDYIRSKDSPTLKP